MYEYKEYVAYRGALYTHGADPEGLYRKLECYLPSATGTYGEPIEATFRRWVDALDSGGMARSFADGLKYRRDADKLVAVKKVKA